jgi:hypothetical protein
MKIYARLGDGNAVSTIRVHNENPGQDWVEISDEDLAEFFLDFRARFWNGSKLTTQPVSSSVLDYYQALGLFIQTFSSVEESSRSSAAQIWPWVSMRCAFGCLAMVDFVKT